MQEISYKKLIKLIKALEKGVKNIKKDCLSTEEVALLLDDARVLHEQIAVLQYLLDKSKPNTNIVTDKRKIKKQEITNDSEEEKQINLLDAIDEEEEKKEEVFSKEDFAGLNENTQSLNEIFYNENSSLADKLSKKPLSNLSSAIGINEKFLFIETLFKGSAQDYKEQIEKLNDQNELSQALAYAKKELAIKFQWNMKSAYVKKFLNLIERRYMK